MQDSLPLQVPVSPSVKQEVWIKRCIKSPSALTVLPAKGRGKNISQASPLRARNAWICWSTSDHEAFVMWLFECDGKVDGYVSKRGDHVEFIGLLSILPDGERVQPGPFVAVPQKVASVTSI